MFKSLALFWLNPLYGKLFSRLTPQSLGLEKQGRNDVMHHGTRGDDAMIRFGPRSV